MQNYVLPSIDEQNPLYCPALPAASYLNSLRRQLRQSHNSRTHTVQPQEDRLLHSFTHILNQAFLQDDNDQPDPTGYDSSRREPSRQLGLKYSIPSWEREVSLNLTLGDTSGHSGLPYRPINPLLKRKRTSFSDIKGPKKQARSFQSINNISFEFSVKREKLYFFVPNAQTTPYATNKYAEPFGRPDPISRKSVPTVKDLALKIRVLESACSILQILVGKGAKRTRLDELYGPPIGTESPRGVKSLIDRLASLMPGIRLKERLSNLNHPTHQNITDFLAENGMLLSNVHCYLPPNSLN
jgi:hypothetical protein